MRHAQHHVQLIEFVDVTSQLTITVTDFDMSSQFHHHHHLLSETLSPAL